MPSGTGRNTSVKCASICFVVFFPSFLEGGGCLFKKKTLDYKSELTDKHDL